MQNFAILAFALGLVAFASAECPNACSGHGTCQQYDNCACDPNWMGNDCSQRVCPYGLAWVDTPKGDLNHDGYYSPKDVNVRFHSQAIAEDMPDPAYMNEAHFYMECSNRGLCDRGTGECSCFDGYSGSSCQRTVCPNDCSGHGVCRTLSEIASGALTKRLSSSIGGDNSYTGVSTAFVYDLWDRDKAQACVCDAGYTGNDCSMRECPRGDDPLTHRNKDCGGATCRDEVQTITIAGDETQAGTLSFKLTFSQWSGMMWTTDVISAAVDGTTHATTASNLATAVKNALKGIPNSVIPEVDVSGSYQSGSGGNFLIAVTFTNNPGNLDIMTATAVSEPNSYGATYTIAETTSGNKEEVVCSNRGLCDYDTGLCKCFKGYYATDCSVQNALAM